MLAEIEQSKPNFDVSNLALDSDLALQLWEERGALINAEDLTREMSQLLEEMSDSINLWDQDRRDAAVALIQALAIRTDGLPLLNGEQQATVGRGYVDVVHSLKSNTDWLGAPWSAMELGHSVAAVLGKEIDFVHGMRLRGQLSEAWSNYVAGVSFNKESTARQTHEERLFRESLRPRLDSLQGQFLARATEASEGLLQRNGPNLNERPAARELALWYGQATRQNSSAKLAVLRATPNYVKSLQERGVNIANFWNLNDPDTASVAIESVLQDPSLANVFKDKFKSKTGIAYESTTPSERQALTDLSINLIRDVYVDLFGRRTSFEDVSQRINSQVEQATALDNPRAKLKPIVKWLRQIDPDFNSYDSAIIQEFIATHQLELRDFHEAKFAYIDSALKTIEASLPAQSSVVRFMDRSLFDLRSANLTADCTAWNLEDGFNAWTVPVWVTNPSFNFAYIYSGNVMAAKFGLILGFDKDQNPQVIIDSIETNKNIPKTKDAELSALESIYAGFIELQHWADRNGFGTLQVCTYTNSKELTAELPLVKNGDDRENVFQGLEFDGLLATRELMQSINPTLGLPEIYLQASAIQEDEEGVFIQGEYTQDAEIFEPMANAALAATRERGTTLIEENALIRALRSGDKEQIIWGLLAALEPDFTAAFEFDYATLEELYDNCRVASQTRNQSFDTVFESVLSSFLHDDDFPDRGMVSPKNEEENRSRHIDFLASMDEDEFRKYLEDVYIKSRSIHNSVVEDNESAEDGDEDEDSEQSSSETDEVSASWADEIAPSTLSVVDYDALRSYIEYGGSRLLDILDRLIPAKVDIIKAAEFIFGVEAKVEDFGDIVPLANLPRYDRREMQAEGF